MHVELSESGCGHGLLSTRDANRAYSSRERLLSVESPASRDIREATRKLPGDYDSGSYGTRLPKRQRTIKKFTTRMLCILEGYLCNATGGFVEGEKLCVTPALQTTNY
jgi:hypothetical protein